MTRSTTRSFARACRQLTLLAPAVALALALAARPVAAIDITLAYDTPADQFPAYDADGSKLQQICSAAAEVWKDLLPFSGNSYGVTIHYSVFPAGSTQLAVYNNFDHTINMRSNANWFIDPTPDENGEFMPFAPSLYRDLSAAQQNSFVGSPPPLLETGYTAVAVPGGVADGKTDMLTVLMHEMGHFTEIGFNLLAPDVALQAKFIGGVDGVAAKREDEGHITPDNALLDPFISQSTRILPSALDVIVAANEQGHSQIRLRRVDWLGDVDAPLNNFWFWSPGWVGGREPTTATAVTIRGDAELLVASAPAYARTLLVAEKSNLTVQDSLTVTLDAEIRGSGLYDHPKIIVPSGGDVAIDRNLVVSLGSLKLEGGTAAIGGLLVLDGGLSGPGAVNYSTLRGHGSVLVGAEVRNRGIIAGEDGTLEVSVAAGGSLDLDGNQEATEVGTVEAEIGNLVFNGPLHDDFNGNTLIKGGHSIRFTEDWTFGSDSFVEFSGASGLGEFFSNSPTSHVTLGGVSLYVNEDSTARIRAANITLSKFVDAYLFDNSILGLNGTIEYQGGKYEGGGTLRQNGDATVNGDVTIDVAQYDWDGFNLPTPARTTVVANGSFTLNVDGFGGTGAYTGRTDLLDHAELTVNITSGFGIWRLAPEGTIRFVENARLKGSPVIVQGTLEAVEGSNHLDVNATLTGTSLVTLHDKASLSFHNPVALGGGTITTTSGNPDDSALHQYSTAHVLEHHLLTVGYFNWDASGNTASHTTIDSDGYLDIRAKEIGNGITNPLLVLLKRGGFGDTVDINGGTLGVQVGFESHGQNFAHEWHLNKSGVMNLNPAGHSTPSVRESKLINDGLISGSGNFYNELLNEAEMRVGHAGQIGTIQLLDAFEQSATGLLAFELGGLAAGTEFDQLFHDELALLAGTLDVSLFGGFQPSPGDSFRIIDGNSLSTLSGTFGTVHLPAGNWDVVYGSYYVDLRFNAVPEPSTAVLILVAGACLVGVRRGRR